MLEDCGSGNFSRVGSGLGQSQPGNSDFYLDEAPDAPEEEVNTGAAAAVVAVDGGSNQQPGSYMYNTEHIIVSALYTFIIIP